MPPCDPDVPDRSPPASLPVPLPPIPDELADGFDPMLAVDGVVPDPLPVMPVLAGPDPLIPPVPDPELDEPWPRELPDPDVPSPAPDWPMFDWPMPDWPMFDWPDWPAPVKVRAWTPEVPPERPVMLS